MLTDLATDLVTALVTALVTDLVMALDMDLVSALVTDLVTALVTRMRRTKQRAHVLLGRHGDKALLGYRVSREAYLGQGASRRPRSIEKQKPKQKRLPLNRSGNRSSATAINSGRVGAWGGAGESRRAG